MASTGANSKSAKIASAFLNGRTLRDGAAYTDGKVISYSGNVIARKTFFGFEVNTQGWNTPTTFRYLNQLPNVAFQMRKGIPYYNDKVYMGGWV